MFLKDNRDSFLFKSATILFFRPQRILQVMINFFRDYRYGGRYLGMTLANENKELGYVNTGSSEYDSLKTLFSGIKIEKEDVLVDVGCGKGRVLNWFLSLNLKNNLVGIEVYPEIADFTRKRLKKYPQVEIITGSVGDDILPDNASIFYLYHPFRELLMRKFANQILQKIGDGIYKKDRPVIVYHNCVYLNVFEENPIWKINRIGKVWEHDSAIISI